MRTRHGMTPTEWAARDFASQMADAGADVGRTFIYRRTGKEARLPYAKKRARDLLLHTIDANLESSPDDARRAMRALEAFLEALDGEPGSLKERALDRYFLAWGIRANEEHAARTAAGEGL